MLILLKTEFIYIWFNKKENPAGLRDYSSLNDGICKRERRS